MTRITGHRIDAVLFDWGDTLFRSPRAADVLVEHARARGIAIDEAAAERVWEDIWTAGKTPEELAKGRDLSPDAHREVWTALFTRADALVPGASRVLYDGVMEPDSWVPFAGAGAVLAQLKERGLKTGIVSNVPRDLRPIFARHGLAGYVDAFVHSYEHGAMKPAAVLFNAACDALGVAPANTLMVGDHPEADGAGAVRAGLQAYVLPPGGGEPDLGEVLRIVDATRHEARVR